MRSIGERLLLTLWVGSLWSIGYIVAPVLFKHLDRTSAGDIAGQLFSIVSYIGLFVIGMMLFMAALQAGRHVLRQWRNRILLIILLIILTGQFVLQPMMADLKAAGLNGETATRFASLHGVASILYLVNSVLALALLIWDNPSSKRHKY